MSLFIVPTPIGNLGDITRRAVEVLAHVGFVIAEDSRYTLKLLNHLGIQKRIVSHYRPKEEQQAEKIVAMLAREDGALVSDSGTPTISDPGFILVNRALAAGIEVVALPGATAFVPALAGSGIDPRRFLFLGFPPRTAGEQRRFLAELVPLPYTLVFYESPRRLAEFLAAATAAFGDRAFALAKEISKRHERVVRSTLANWRTALASEPLLGEMVVVIAGGTHAPQEAAPEFNDIDDLYAFFQQRYGLGKNALKKVLMKKKAKAGPAGRPG